MQRFISMIFLLFFVFFITSANPTMAEGSEDVLVSVLVDPTCQIKDLPGNILQVNQVEEETIVRLRLPSQKVRSLQKSPGVLAVFKSAKRIAPAPIDPDLPKRQQELTVIQKIREQAANAPGYHQSQPLKCGPMAEMAQKSWWGKDDIGSQAVWDMGYRGEGVSVAVIDSGIDFCHPDLMGTQQRVSDTQSPHYNWPVCFDGNSASRYFVDGQKEGHWIVDTSTTPEVTVNGSVASASFEVPSETGEITHLYTFNDESVSGVYRFGVHPDLTLMEYLGGEAAAVLLVDHSDTATRGPGYNTVYVDLDGDHDFTDEKPCYWGDELSYRDIYDHNTESAGSDGYPDLSGGMVYFIANGVRPFPVADWMYNAPVPTNGECVAFMICDNQAAGGDHGIFCASAVSARGIINGNAPAIKPPYSGPGNGMVQGPAPNASLISVGNYYEGGSMLDYHLFCAMGYDGKAETGDEPQIVSMSYGNGRVDNDGWDYQSRMIESIHRRYAPTTSWIHSSGNGGPGYATVSTPAPPTGISVGASTQYDSCNAFEPINSVEQIVSGDVQNWSCSGPQANGLVGVDVIANGAWGSGNVPLNLWGNGWNAWDYWGGTSRSCPEAAGVMALIYQAYRQQHGTWPTAVEARQLIMNGAVDKGHTVLRQGAGLVNAYRSVQLALQSGGVEANPGEWIPGDYRGTEYQAYASMMKPGETRQKVFQVTNHNDQPVSLTVEGVEHEQIGIHEFDFTTIVPASTEYDFRRPDYLYQLQGDSLNNIPVGTDLMVIESIHPFGEFDLDYDLSDPTKVYPGAENVYRLLVYNWTDWDENGILFDDSLGVFPGIVESGEITQGEYIRFNYAYNDSNNQLMFVHDPLERMADGIWIGLQHRTGRNDGFASTIQVRVRFYRQTASTWLSATPAVLNLAAGETASVTATVLLPNDFSYGVYPAKLLLRDSAKDANSSVLTSVPVNLNVAAELNVDQPVQFGAATADNQIYSNNSVSGDFDWGGRTESGDGRIFFMDTTNLPDDTYLYVKTAWQDQYPTDIDTLLFSPESDAFTTVGQDEYNSAFGPNTLVHTAGVRSPGRPDWTFQTRNGDLEDNFLTPVGKGLHELFVHNVLFSGNQFAVPFTIDVQCLLLQPSKLVYRSTTNQVQGQLSIAHSSSNLALELYAYGPSRHLYFNDGTISEGESWTYNFSTQSGRRISFDLSSDAKDLDLFLLRDGADGSDPDGSFSWDEIVNSSESSTSSETIEMINVPDGDYQVVVYGFNVSVDDSPFLLEGSVVQGEGVTVTPVAKNKMEKQTVTDVYQLAMTLPEIGQYDFLLDLRDAGKSIGYMNAQAFFDPTGDLDDDGVLTAVDVLDFSQYWGQRSGVPAQADFSFDNQVFFKDLIGLIKAWKEDRSGSRRMISE